MYIESLVVIRSNCGALFVCDIGNEPVKGGAEKKGETGGLAAF
jgi:hypothetical protein